MVATLNRTLCQDVVITARKGFVLSWPILNPNGLPQKTNSVCKKALFK